METLHVSILTRSTRPTRKKRLLSVYGTNGLWEEVDSWIGDHMGTCRAVRQGESGLCPSLPSLPLLGG